MAPVSFNLKISRPLGRQFHLVILLASGLVIFLFCSSHVLTNFVSSFRGSLCAAVVASVADRGVLLFTVFLERHYT